MKSLLIALIALTALVLNACAPKDDTSFKPVYTDFTKTLEYVCEGLINNDATFFIRVYSYKDGSYVTESGQYTGYVGPEYDENDLSFYIHTYTLNIKNFMQLTAIDRQTGSNVVISGASCQNP